MIEIEGQYTLNIKILMAGGAVAFEVAPEEFVNLKVVEESGNQMPTMQMDLKLAFEKDVAHLHEGNRIQIQFGNRLVSDPKKPNLMDSEFTITKIESVREGQQTRNIKIVGIYSAMAFMTKPKMTAIGPCCGIDALSEIAGRHGFTFDTNITPSPRKQIWLQPNTTDRRFMSHVWQHLYIEDSFPTLGLTCNNKFRVLDTRKHLSGEPKWRFVPDEAKGGNEAIYMGDFKFQNDSGFINNWAGYGFDIPEYDRDRDEFEYVEHNHFKPMYSNSDQFDRHVDSVTKLLPQHWHSDNTHDRFWFSRYNNLSYLSLSSTVKITCQLSRHPMGDMEVLDSVNFIDNNSDRPTGVSGLYSGVYMINKLIRHITTNRLTTVVELVRDSANFDAVGTRK